MQTPLEGVETGKRGRKVDLFLNRLVGAIKLKARVYEEVESDPGAMGQAVGAVVLSSLAAGIGGIGTLSTVGVFGILAGTASALVGWFLWAYITFIIGAKMFPEPRTLVTSHELLRTIGFASAPGLIRVIGIVPGLAALVFAVAAVWMFAAMVLAVRQALEYRSTLRAFGVCFLGWLVQLLLLFLLLPFRS
jgi:hypothetical protein